MKKIKNLIKKIKTKKKKRKLRKKLRKIRKKVFTKNNLVKFVVGVLIIAMVVSSVLPYFIR